MVSCANTYEAKTVELGSQNDSVNYFLAYLSGSQLRMQAFQDVDSADVDAAIAAFMDAYVETMNSDKEEEEPSRAAEVGQSIGGDIKTFEEKGVAGVSAWGMNEKLYFAGMAHALAEDTTCMDQQTALMFLQAEFQKAENDTVEHETPKAKTAKFSTKVKKVSLKNLTDSINFAFGYYMGSQVKMYILSNDSDGSEEKVFVEALNKAVKEGKKFPQLAQAGKQYASQIKAQMEDGLLGIPELEVDKDILQQGFVNGMYMSDETPLQDMDEYLNATLSHLRFGKNIAEGEAFLALKAEEEGVQKTESGLMYKVIKEGKGARPTTADVVEVHYEGRLIDGTVFDSSYQRGESIKFGVTQVIAGWTEALQLMTVGSTYELYIPYYLAYGERGAGGNIPPYATLIFKVELLGISK